MQKRLTSLVLIAIACGVLAGCSSGCKSTTSTDPNTGATNTVQTLDIDRVTRDIDAMLPPVVQVFVSKEPKAADYLDAFATAVDTFTTGNQLDPASLDRALKTTKVNELNTDDTRAIVLAVLGAYKVAWGNYLEGEVDKSQQAKDAIQVLQAISGAIRQVIPAKSGMFVFPPGDTDKAVVISDAHGVPMFYYDGHHVYMLVGPGSDACPSVSKYFDGLKRNATPSPAVDWKTSGL